MSRHARCCACVASSCIDVPVRSVLYAWQQKRYRVSIIEALLERADFEMRVLLRYHGMIAARKQEH